MCSAPASRICRTPGNPRRHDAGTRRDLSRRVAELGGSGPAEAWIRRCESATQSNIVKGLRPVSLTSRSHAASAGERRWPAPRKRKVLVLLGFSVFVFHSLAFPCVWALNFFSFPRIPSSESGLFNGLRAMCCENAMPTPAVATTVRRPQRLCPQASCKAGGFKGRFASVHRDPLLVAKGGSRTRRMGITASTSGVTIL
jgi:hypothetical protein